MGDINHVVLVGRLTRDMELKYTNTGLPIGKLGIAINRRRKKDDAWVDEANFFNVTLMGKIAESLQPYLTKGKQVGIEGELHQSKWEQNGQARSSVEVFATNVQLLGGTGGAGGTGGGRGSSPGRDSTSYTDHGSESSMEPIDDFEDDIPF